MGMRLFRAQGATEYLVLLAVVLIVALVSVALLGFFPGMASDAQMTQSQAYWKSTSPIAIIEMSAKYESGMIYSKPYLRVRNTGTYPIRITKLVSSSGSYSISQFNDGSSFQNISDYYYLAPGEEKYFGRNGTFAGLPLNRDIGFSTTGGGGSHYLYSPAVCPAVGAGVMSTTDFGFEYIEYVEGQQITKRQIGKPLIIKCTG